MHQCAADCGVGKGPSRIGVEGPVNQSDDEWGEHVHIEILTEKRRPT